MSCRLGSRHAPITPAPHSHGALAPRLLPPYSPDDNPIEPAWSKLKTLLRGAGARTTDALHATLVDAITPGDVAGRFRHCGYAR